MWPETCERFAVGVEGVRWFLNWGSSDGTRTVEVCCGEDGRKGWREGREGREWGLLMLG